jgi:hypothetical protein
LVIAIKYYDHLIFYDYKKFRESSINGEIHAIDIKRRGVELKIKNDSSHFVFYPNTNQELNGGHIFDYFPLLLLEWFQKIVDCCPEFATQDIYHIQIIYLIFIKNTYGCRRL